MVYYNDYFTLSAELEEILGDFSCCGRVWILTPTTAAWTYSSAVLLSEITWAGFDMNAISWKVEPNH